MVLSKVDDPSSSYLEVFPQPANSFIALNHSSFIRNESHMAPRFYVQMSIAETATLEEFSDLNSDFERS